MAGIDFLSECEYERDVAIDLIDKIVTAGHVACLVEPRCGLCFCCEVITYVERNRVVRETDPKKRDQMFRALNDVAARAARSKDQS